MAKKNFNRETDYIALEATDLEELFYPRKAITKPYSAANNIELETNISSSSYPSYYSEVQFVEKDGSDVIYFSVSNGDSGSYQTSSGSALTYHYIRSLTKGENVEYTINDGTTEDTIEKITAVSINREWYKDGVDNTYFSVFINTGSSTPTSSVSSFDLNGGIKAIVPVSSEDAKVNTIMGDKYYMYPTKDAFTSELYNPSTDEFTSIEKENLDLTNPLGELYRDYGLIVLYRDRIKATFAGIDDADPLNFIAGVGGRSRFKINSEIYYARLTNKEYNLSLNPTYYINDDVSSNLPKEHFRDNPKVFITGINYYNDIDELIAVGRLNKPIEKTLTNEITVVGALAV